VMVGLEKDDDLTAYQKCTIQIQCQYLYCSFYYAIHFYFILFLLGYLLKNLSLEQHSNKGVKKHVVPLHETSKDCC
jgi:hypothetical protein